MPVKIMAQENNNRFDSWKTSAIITPEAKELKPAGNIDVAFNQFAVDDIVIDHYDIYIDGQKVNVVFADGKDILKTSIYLTKTDYYQLQVVAVTKDNHEFSSNIRKFQVCKKGLNIDDKAVNAPVANMQESWYYNWSYTPSTNVTGSKEFVPMIWDENSLSWLESDQVANYTTILGFNEPDLTNQANLSVLQAASYQDLFTKTGLRIGSPATSYPTNEWYQEYGKTVNMDDIDFIPVHIYYDWAGEGMAQAFLEAIDTLYQLYHKPIWVSEFGVANSGLYGANSNYDEAYKQISTYLKETIAGLEARDYVERYTWFNFDDDDVNGGKTALYDQQTGQLTDLGKLYKSLGNPNIEGIDLNDEYVEDAGYYIDLDKIISKADELIASSDYDQYINVETFENILNQAKAIDRNLGSSSQFIIDDLYKQLLEAYNGLEKQTVTPELPKEDKVTKQTELSNSSSVATGDTSNVLMLMLLMLISYSGFKFVNK